MWQGQFDEKVVIAPDANPVEAASALPTCRGVLFFVDEHETPIQLLIAANIRRLAAARLVQSEDETSRKADIAAIARFAYARCCHSAFRTQWTHLHLARRIWPDQYREYVTLPRQTYVKIDPSQTWPEFTLTNSPLASAEERIFGPFPSRRAAGAFREMLVDVFVLCREPTLVASPDKAAGCPYLQMDQCPAPCVGRISREEYLATIALAIRTAEGDIEPARQMLTSRMKAAAAAMEFEKAQALKQRLALLDQRAAERFSWTGDVTNLAILHIDRSARIRREGQRRKVQTWAAFLIQYGRILDLGDPPAEPDALQSLLDTVHEVLMNPVDTPEDSPRTTAEHLALTAYFLYQSTPPGLWFNLRPAPRAADLIHTIEKLDHSQASGKSTAR